MRALWDRQAAQTQSANLQWYGVSRRRRLRSLTPIDNSISTPNRRPTSSTGKDGMVLQALANILNPCSAFWRWSTPNRLDIVSELIAAFHIGPKKIAATIAFFVALVLSFWLF